MTSITTLGFAAIFATAMATAAHASGYDYSQINVPGNIVTPTGDQGQALSINDQGQVLVSALNFSSAADNVDFNAVYNIHTQAFTALPAFPGAVANSTLANGINNSGEIVGQYDPGVVITPYGNVSAFSYAGGVYTAINPLGDSNPQVFALAVSNNGLITGADDNIDSMGNALSSQGFVGSGNLYTAFQFGSVPGTFTVGRGVNNSGTVAGHYALPSGVHGMFLDQGGVITDITTPGIVEEVPGQLNDAGMLVGYVTFDPTYSVWDSFIYDAGTISYFSYPGSTQTFATSINDLGDIVGQYLAPDGSYQAFLAVPIPEPATWALMLVGFGGIGFVVRGRRAGHTGEVVERVA